MFFDNKLELIYIVYTRLTVLKTMNKCNVKDMHTYLHMYIHLHIHTCTYTNTYLILSIILCFNFNKS